MNKKAPDDSTNNKLCLTLLCVSAYAALAVLFVVSLGLIIRLYACRGKRHVSISLFLPSKGFALPISSSSLSGRYAEE
jgi:hypothetical protein